MVELRKLVDRCQFTEYLEEALCDRLVCGLCNEAIQRRLLTMDEHRVVKPIPSKARLTVEVAIGGQPLVMELNTRASVSIVSEGTWTKVLKGRSLQPSPIWLKNIHWSDYQGFGPASCPG